VTVCVFMCLAGLMLLVAWCQEAICFAFLRSVTEIEFLSCLVKVALCLRHMTDEEMLLTLALSLKDHFNTRTMSLMTEAFNRGMHVMRSDYMLTWPYFT